MLVSLSRNLCVPTELSVAGLYNKEMMMKRYYSFTISLGLSIDTFTPAAPSNKATLLTFANSGQRG